jgi:hypothetical protein
MLGIPYKNNLWLQTPRRDWSRGIMALVFGHSVWGTTDGLFELPKGSQIGFFNDAGENMNAQKAISLIFGMNSFRRPDVIVEQYKGIQNLSLLPAPEYLGRVRAAFESANRKNEAIPIITSNRNEGVTLKTIVETFPDKYIIWLGCRARQVI